MHRYNIWWHRKSYHYWVSSRHPTQDAREVQCGRKILFFFHLPFSYFMNEVVCRKIQLLCRTTYKFQMRGQSQSSFCRWNFIHKFYDKYWVKILHWEISEISVASLNKRQTFNSFSLQGPTFLLSKRYTNKWSTTQWQINFQAPCSCLTLIHRKQYCLPSGLCIS